MKNTKMPSLDLNVMNAIVRRAHYLACRMIDVANHRDNKEKGDPKVGGHASASASALHILGAIHLVMKSGFDHVANKPHASPADHAYNYLLNLFLHEDLSRFSEDEKNQTMHGLRAFSQNGEPVLQSYHSAYDPDHHNFLPSGTVGIPPVNAGYLALAYRYARQHKFEVPDAHFWCVCGDSEFREGSLHEAIPDLAEREVGNLTWIIDYNRQSLDGHRIPNNKVMGYTDDQRIKRVMEANGWEVLEARHGRKRLKYFGRPGGEEFRQWFEHELNDYELQALLLVKDSSELVPYLRDHHGGQIKNLDKFLKNMTAKEIHELLHDFGGHDFDVLLETFQASKNDPRRPTLIIAHTIKGWGLEMAGQSGNHSALPEREELDRLQKETGLKPEQLFAGFSSDSAEGKYLRKRGDELYAQIKEQHALKARNVAKFTKAMSEFSDANGSATETLPPSLDINFKMANYPHTQWMLGQLTSKLTRIANTPLKNLNEKMRALTDSEKKWKAAAELMVEMAPDVGTSTNLNPTMDGKIFGAEITADVEEELHVKDHGTPDLVPGEQVADRFLRFEIAEANVMSCLGSFGRLRDILGIPVLPLMTVYDFFVKRALDQYFYDLYWKSSFILVGTPSGVTLSPEGAQHGWKSDIQIPNQILWEPFFVQELDWIFCESIRRHMTHDNDGRTGVHIRGVTRGVDQKDFLKYLRMQRRFKSESAVDWAQTAGLHAQNFTLDGAIDESTVAPVDDAEILLQIRADVLSGAYYLIDYRGYAGYEPGDNVVHIFSLGSPTTEAIKASQALLDRGIYANVIVVTSPDLLLGNLAHENDYHHLRHGLQIDSTLFVKPMQNGHLETPEVLTVAGRRIPIVSVHDGEPGLLDNIGSLVGVRHEALAVRKHSKCGRPSDVYKYHHIDADSIVDACGKVLSETALEQTVITKDALRLLDGDTRETGRSNWHELWTRPPQH